jgi:two-component system chemotaxis response regulator CheY
MAYNILIVDDSNVIRKVMRKTLGLTPIAFGEIFDAEHGLQALEILKHHWVDLVFLDINMPVMDGMQFMEALRADPATKDTKVVIVSTEGSKERIERLRELGAKRYLRKPVTPEQIVEVINELVEGK